MPAWHAPVARSHLSIPLHASPSSHWAAELQQPSIGVLLHVSVAPSQGSLVHTTPSAQLGDAPVRQRPVQLPLLQVSSVVHLLLSSQAAVLGLLTQLPVPGSQLSSVQTLPSSQFGGGPPTQLPFLQASSVVQASPSLQAVPLAFAGFEHVPVAGLQVPAVWH